MMREMNRKQITLCRKCHREVHGGRYDGVALRRKADPGGREKG